MERNIDKSPETISKMFSAIAPRYDLMNDLMTGFSHRFTRKFALNLISFPPIQVALDLATGTGDFAYLLHKKMGGTSNVIGVDLSFSMLLHAKARKNRIHKLKYGQPEFIHNDINSLPFTDCTFDVCTISYGIRNVQDPELVMKEIFRVTKPGGKVVIVESIQPRHPIIRFLVAFHFKHMVPLLARIFSSDASAYLYFYKSVEQFASTTKFLKIMKKEGWKRVIIFSKLLGSVIVILGTKD